MADKSAMSIAPAAAAKRHNFAWAVRIMLYWAVDLSGAQYNLLSEVSM